VGGEVFLGSGGGGRVFERSRRYEKDSDSYYWLYRVGRFGLVIYDEADTPPSFSWGSVLGTRWVGWGRFSLFLI